MSHIFPCTHTHPHTDEVEDLIKLSLREPVRLFVDRNTSVTSNLTQEFVRIRPTKEGDREAIVLSLIRRTYRSRVVVSVMCGMCVMCVM